MLLNIDFASDEAIYMQIRNGIVSGIAMGRLQDGDPLPSIRTLGAEIGVNLHTVNKAYKLLQSEGFIEIQRNRGTFIHAGNAAKNTAQFLETTGDSLHDIVSEAVTRHVDRAVIHKMVDNLYDELGRERN
ncbi:GntR family transcriptional regulator [Sporolactobacillus sp. THM19-2]|jgi:DNA-binding transcriptional regulator YhcF (GntR family)|uniref:GntR family transcriptional regulator n=1 Tax=Sporolactobacillus sp. THM19-2 TaxID=2511171 RepID=UPI0010205355|nr:GntR family transcriptional regulator [Sporolactobacillus sp. THM19-2]RYL90445.1 GntR family transcriptional regulator [Sporolactobacillus sp. THM19-2]